MQYEALLADTHETRVILSRWVDKVWTGNDAMITCE